MSTDAPCPSSPTSSAISESSTGRRTSDVYAFVREQVDFTPQGKNKKSTWTCTECASGDREQTWEGRSTSNFRTHLKRFHGDVYKETVNSESRTNKVVVVGGDQVFTAHDQDEATDLLVEWIVTHSQPFRVVEEESFKAFCAKLCSAYRVPCRSTVHDKIQKMWLRERERVRSILMRETSGRRVGFTTDLWTSGANRGYMAITVHYINDNWEHKSLLVAFIRVLSPHTGVRLADHFVKGIEEFDVGLLQSIWGITCDNAANNEVMVNALVSMLPSVVLERRSSAETDIIQMMWSDDDETVTTPVKLRCVAHVLQLAVKEGLKHSPVVESSISTIRDVIKKIRDSPKLFEAFDRVCAQASVKSLKPQLDVDTRWNSTWLMIGIALTLRQPIDILLRLIRVRCDGFTDLAIAPTDRMAQPITEEMWAAAGMYHRFLTPFKEATDLMSASTYPTLGMIVPVFSLIEHHIEDSDDEADSAFNSFVQAVRRKFREYGHVTRLSEVRIAAGLDPRIKNHLTTFGEDREEIKQLLINEYNVHYSDSQTRRASRGGATPEHHFPRTGRLPLIQSMIRARVAADNFGVGQVPFWKEVERWFDNDGLAIDAKSSEVGEWFRHNSVNYPRIAMIARDYLALPATSVPSEIAFSKAGCVVREHRSRLSDKSIRAVCELRSFMAFK